MSFTIRIILAIIALFLVELYFYKRTKSSFGKIFERINAGRFNGIFKYSVIYFNLYPLLSLLFWIAALLKGSQLFVPPKNIYFDLFMVYPFWIFILIVLQSSLFFIPLDIFALAVRYVFKNNNLISKSRDLLIVIISVFFLIYVPVRVIYDQKVVSLRITEFAKEKLSDDLKDFKLILIADIQADWYTDESRLQNYIDKINQTEPDLVLIAGDIITSTPLYINTAAEFIGKINSKYGIYSCVGDHDNWAYRPDAVKSREEISKALRDKGAFMVDDSNKVISVGSSKIGITFVTDTYSKRISESSLGNLMSTQKESTVKILLTHQPGERIIGKAIANDYDLFLAGHTHGGQITFIFPFIELTPTLLETKYVKGDFILNGMLMIVNRGLGMSISPVRYNSTPEVTLIVFKDKE